MPFSCKSSRFAHSEGHTDLCYDPSGKYLLTCGADGEVRIWEGAEDDDPRSHRAGDVVYSLLYKNDKFYTASDDNTVCMYTFSDATPDGVLVRFTSPVYHIVANAPGTRFYAGAGDFLIKMIEPNTGSQKMMQGHEAPILSLALHPKEKFLASSSCDGTVRVWELPSCKQVKSFTLIPKSNDFSLSQTLCRLCWSMDGMNLFVPVGQEVQAYSNTWEKAFVLKCDEISQTVNIVAASPCGRYLAAGCRNGLIVIWNLRTKKFVNSDQHDKKLTITGLTWHPERKDELTFCDNYGNLGVMEGVLPLEEMKQAVGIENTEQFEDLFDDDGEDDIMMQAEASAMVEGGGESMADHMPNPLADSDDDDDISSTHKPSRAILDDDTRDSDMTSKKSDTDNVLDAPPPRPVYKGPELTPPQRPFQPGSTPVHLSHRFMIWNTVGIIRQYNTDEENSIDVEFHNTATHHPLHVTNTMNHTIAALSTEAVLLACQSDEDTPSKLVCMHFGTWDNSKEWTVAMTEGEDIQALAIGEGWLAVATDRRLVRLFTVSGVQRETVSLPGPVVAMAAQAGQLMVVYHSGVGLPGDQALAVMILQLTGKRRALVNGTPLPIAHRSTLAWLGFSEEGSPLAVDTQGYMYMLNRKFGSAWTQVASLKNNCKGKTDNYFVIGVQENPPQIRCILCKGAKYPATLPRPAMSIVSFQLPLCEMATEKGTLEETYWRHVAVTSYLDDYDVDDVTKAHALMPQQETLMKMFALACKMQREARALDICKMMNTQHTVQLAIKYATRLRMMQLAQRLTDVAREKAEQEAAEQEVEQEEEFYTPAISKPQSRQQQQDGDTEEMEAEDADSQDAMERDEEEENKPAPLLMFKSNKTPVQRTPTSVSSSQQGSGKRNPFKVGSQSSGPGIRGTSVFDNMKNTPPSRVLTNKSPNEKNKKKKGMAQMTLMGSKSSAKKENKETPPAKKGGKTGFQLWLENNKEDLEEENPELSEADLTMLAAKRFKELSTEEKKEWQNKVGVFAEVEDRKRKRSEEEKTSSSEKTKSEESNEDSVKRKKSIALSTNSKLAGFAFGKE